MDSPPCVGTPYQQLLDVVGQFTSSQPLDTPKAEKLAPFVERLGDSLEDSIAKTSACQELTKRHRDLCLRLLHNESVCVSSVLLTCKANAALKSQIQSIGSDKPLSIPVTKRAMNALQLFWCGIPFKQLVAMDPGDGEFLAELYQATLLFGDKELLSPQKWAQTITNVHTSQPRLLFAKNQFLLDSPLSNPVELQEVRRLLHLLDVVGIHPRCRIHDLGNPSHLQYLGYLLRDHHSGSPQALTLHHFHFTEEGGKAFTDALKANTALKRLEIHKSINDSETTAIADALVAHPSLQNLTLKIEGLDYHGSRSLASLLENNTSIKNLRLKFLKMGPSIVSAVVAGLEKNTQLQDVTISIPRLGFAPAFPGRQKLLCLFQALVNHPSVRRLKIGDIVGDEEMALVADLLNQNSPLTEVTLKCYYLGDKGAETLASLIEKHTSLKAVTLGHASLGFAGTAALTDALKKSPSLEAFRYYDSTGDHDREIKAMAEALGQNTSLKKVDLSWGPANIEGIKALAQALRKNGSLQKIHLNGLQVGDKGARIMATVLEGNSTLTKVDLSRNGIHNRGAKAIAEAMKKNSTVKKIRLSDNKIQDVGAKALAEALPSSTLTTLDLGWNHIGDKGAKAFAEALRNNPSLQTINLRGNKMTSEGSLAIAYALETNTNLRRLGLGNWSLAIQNIKDRKRWVEIRS